MSFGLNKAPVAFIDLMNRVFHELLDSLVLVFIDNILIYCKTIEDNEHHLGMTLQLLTNIISMQNSVNASFD